ncbi:MAG: S8 family serine peptidase [Pseudomonadota bacterium]|nr:S8 family serine peptidase [Pseudomonadota bacterium]
MMLTCARGAVLLLALAGVGSAQAQAERGPAFRAVPVDLDTEARVIVKFRAASTLARASATASGTAPLHARELSNRLGLVLRDGRTIGARAQVVRAQGLTSRQLAERLAAEPDVDYAVVDRRVHAYAVPNDPLFGLQTSATPAAGQWYLRAPTSATIVDATTVVSAIDAQAAWNITRGNRSVVVADLDTGVRPDHPDLAPKLLAGYDFISDVTTANDGNGRDADPSDPGDYGCATGAATSSWHGTQTAGLIGAATNNGAGMASVGYNVMLLPVRVLGKCGGFDSDIQAAMLWAADPLVNPNPAKVINLSLGSTGACGPGFADVLGQVAAAGVVVVAAAGNDGLAVGSPANCPGVISVAGVRHAGTKVGYSDLGPQITIAAPAGNCVNATGNCLFPLLTTSNSGSKQPVPGAAGAIYTGGGATASLGTSFAAPLVSGTVALMFAANPGLTPAQVAAALKNTARPFPSSGSGTGVAACVDPATTTTAQNAECYCNTSVCGAGLLDAGRAVAAVAVVVSNIAVASTVGQVGTPVVLDGSSSTASTAGGSLSYQWAIASGPAVFTSATNAATATLVPSAAGVVSATLTVTDNTGQQSSSDVAITVVGPTAVASPAPSSGGGGGLGLVWVCGALASVLAVRAVRPGRQRKR